MGLLASTIERVVCGRTAEESRQTFEVVIRTVGVGKADDSQDESRSSHLRLAVCLPLD